MVDADMGVKCGKQRKIIAERDQTKYCKIHAKMVDDKESVRAVAGEEACPYVIDDDLGVKCGKQRKIIAEIDQTKYCKRHAKMVDDEESIRAAAGEDACPYVIDDDMGAKCGKSGKLARRVIRPCLASAMPRWSTMRSQFVPLLARMPVPM